MGSSWLPMVSLGFTFGFPFGFLHDNLQSLLDLSLRRSKSQPDSGEETEPSREKHRLPIGGLSRQSVGFGVEVKPANQIVFSLFQRAFF